MIQCIFRRRLDFIAAALLPMFLAAVSTPAEPIQTEHVVLVTIDGVRIQELFGGADPVLLDAGREFSGIQKIGDVRTRFMRPTPDERRRALMPFFWGGLVREGIVVGNPALRSRLRLTNSFRVSYPGYAEMLTGADQPKVASNLPFRMPRPTVLEFLKDRMGWSYSDVAVFGSWETFNLIAHHHPDAFFTNAGYARVPAEWATPGMEPLNTLQMQMLTPWDNVRFDRVTFGLAMEFLRAHRPRLLYLALGEPDDWGHNRRYDRVLQSIAEADNMLRELWETLESMDDYRGRTTLIVTTDHGRGVTPGDWTDHDRDTPGSEDAWIAVFGPDTPKLGELSGTPDATLDQVASTLARFFGQDYRAHYPPAAPPLAEAFPRD
jgi:hypothetical protein